jgi:hypothetical protein
MDSLCKHQQGMLCLSHGTVYQAHELLLFSQRIPTREAAQHCCLISWTLALFERHAVSHSKLHLMFTVICILIFEAAGIDWYLCSSMVLRYIMFTLRLCKWQALWA